MWHQPATVAVIDPATAGDDVRRVAPTPSTLSVNTPARVPARQLRHGPDTTGWLQLIGTQILPAYEHERHQDLTEYRTVRTSGQFKRGCKNYGSGALSVVLLSEEDAVAQESEAGSAVHLSLEELRFRVDAFGASVVVLEGDSSGDGVDVLVDASGEGMHVG